MKYKIEILDIIQKLDDLPADHEPDTSDLWDAIRRIKPILEK